MVHFKKENISREARHAPRQTGHCTWHPVILRSRTRYNRLCFKYGVTSIPMLNVYVNGEVVKTIIGAKPKPALLKELEGFI